MDEEEKEIRLEDLDDRELETLEELKAFHRVRLDSLPPIVIPPGFRLLNKRNQDQTKTFLTGDALFISNATQQFSGVVKTIHRICRMGLLYVVSDEKVYNVEVPFSVADYIRVGQVYTANVHQILREGQTTTFSLRQAQK